LRLQQINDAVRRSKKFAKIAVKNELLTSEDVDVALETLQREGWKRSLGELLVEEQKLTAQQERAIQRAISRTERKVPAAEPGERSVTARLESALLLDVEPLPPETAADARARDLLFAAIAFRDGLVLVPE